MRLRYKEGRAFEVGSNQPFLLSDREMAWIVYKGTLDLFAVRLEGDRITGARHHLLRLEPGQGCLGVGPGGGTEQDEGCLGVLAVGSVGASVIRVRRTRLGELAVNPAFGGQVIAMLDGWVDGLSAALGGAIPPENCVQLDVGDVAWVDATPARPRREVLWLRLKEGTAVPFGSAALSPLPQDAFFPVSRHMWLQAAAGTRLELTTTRAFLGSAPDWTALDRFHATALRSLALAVERSEAAQRERLAARAQADQAATDRALRGLASILEPQPELPMPGGDALLAACRLVGSALDVEVRPAPRTDRPAGRETLGQIARASRLRLRAVTLEREWWRHDSGPLLAFMAATSAPVALLPAGRERYTLRDPAAGSVQEVTPEIAAALLPDAWMFYRPLSDGALKAADLLHFGMHGTRGDLLSVLAMGAVGGLLALAIPLAIGILFDEVLPSGGAGQILQLAAVLFIAGLANGLFELTRRIAMLRLEGRIDLAAQAGVWDRLLSLPAPFFRRYIAGDLAGRAAGVTTIRQLLTGATIAALLGAVFSLFSLGLMFVYSARLALVALTLVLAILAVTSAASYRQLRRQRGLLESEGRIAGLVLQLLTGIAKLRVAGAETRAFARWAEQYQQQRRLRYQVRTIENSLAVFNSAYPLLTSLAIFGTVGLAGVSMSAGSFLAFTAAFSQFLAAVLALNAAATSVLRAVPTYERLQPILQTLPEVDTRKAHPGDLRGAIEVSHATFRYTPNGPPVLSDVSLHARPGEFIAIVGPSGSGKSTLFRLLLGFETQQSGTVAYDGQDLAGLDVAAVRRQMGVVLQTGRLLPGSIYQNIVGASHLTVEEAWEAARVAGLEEDIRQLPMGMFTFVSEGGATFSGGQRQRLLIARAVVSKPRLLLFDEATSALDSKSQEQITRALANLQATRIVIAHRLSTILQADRIYVLVNGAVAQEGTYQELINRPGPFADLAKRQLA